MDLSVGHRQDGFAGSILQQAHRLPGRDWYRYINLHLIVIIVYRGDDDRVLPMPCECILAVGQQQLLVAAAVKRLILIVDAANGGDEFRKLTLESI